MNSRNLVREFNQASRISGEFTLRSGTKTDTYFDKYAFEANPQLLRAIAEARTVSQSTARSRRGISGGDLCSAWLSWKWPLRLTSHQASSNRFVLS